MPEKFLFWVGSSSIINSWNITDVYTYIEGSHIGGMLYKMKPLKVSTSPLLKRYVSTESRLALSIHIPSLIKITAWVTMYFTTDSCISIIYFLYHFNVYSYCSKRISVIIDYPYIQYSYSTYEFISLLLCFVPVCILYDLRIIWKCRTLMKEKKHKSCFANGDIIYSSMVTNVNMNIFWMGFWNGFVCKVITYLL